MAISKNDAYQSAETYGAGKVGFQTALQYCVEQAFHGNANEATVVFKKAKMISAATDKLLADGKSVLDYCELVLNFKLLAFESETGSFKMVKDWQASVDTIDLASLWIHLTTNPWYSWKKEQDPPSAPTLPAAIGKLEKAVKKIKACTAEEQKTALDSLAILITAIKAMPIVEPEGESEGERPVITAKPTNLEYDAAASIAAMHAEEIKFAELRDNQIKIAENYDQAETSEAREFWNDVRQAGARKIAAQAATLH